MFPFLAKLGQETLESRTPSQALQERIGLEEGIAGESVVRGIFNPLLRPIEVAERGIDLADGVRGVMKMAKAAADPDRGGDIGFGAFPGS